MWIRCPKRVSRAAVVVSVAAALPSFARAETIHAARDGNEIARFDSATPATVVVTTVTGLSAGESLVGIDFRPANGALYGITDQGRIYTIAPATGAATLASTSSTLPSGASFAVDFNPVADRMRVVSDTGQNLRINVDTGAAIVDVTLAYAALDPNVLVNPAVAGNAYTNSAAGLTTTSLYGIDVVADALVLQNPPNNGTLTTIGALGVDAAAAGGFDISRVANTAYAALSVGGVAGLYRIDLATGAATAVGTIGDGANVRGLAVEPPAAPADVLVYGVTQAGDLVSFASTAPAALTTIAPVTGIEANETISGIDFRPADGKLYLLVDNGRFYTIDTTNGVATLATTLLSAVAGGDFGTDFNPVADRLRVVSDTDQNVRADPATGTVSVDANLAYAATDAHFGADPLVVANAYTNDLPGAVVTTLYGIDAGLDLLVRQDPPNNGTLTTVGALGFDAGRPTAFDIARGANLAFAALTPDAGPTRFCSVDLASGRATLIGPVGASATLRAMAIAQGPSVGVSQLIVHFNYKRPGNDKIQVKGTLPTPVGFTEGAVVVLDIGGASQSFTLDEKGRARVGGHTFALEGKPKDGRVKFSAQLKKGAFAAALADEGMGGSADAKKEARSVLATVTFRRTLHERVVPLSYTAKAGKTGIAKFLPSDDDD